MFDSAQETYYWCLTWNEGWGELEKNAGQLQYKLGSGRIIWNTSKCAFDGFDVDFLEQLLEHTKSVSAACFQDGFFARLKRAFLNNGERFEKTA